MCALDANMEYYESDLENLGYNIQEISFLEKNEFLVIANFLFDCNGKLVKEYKYTIDNCCIFTNKPFDNGVAFVVDDNKKDYDDRKYALMNIQGDLITEFYDDIDEGWVDNTFIAVEKNKKWGIIDKFGRQIVDFIFDWRGWDYEWLHESTLYEIMRVYRDDGEYNLALFASTGKLVLQPIYKTITINSEFTYIKNYQDRLAALVNDEIVATDFDGNTFRWTHYSGLEKIK